MIQPITILVIESLSEGEMLKIAKIVPIFKSKDKQNIENYHPISILPSISKIYENNMDSDQKDQLMMQKWISTIWFMKLLKTMNME